MKLNSINSSAVADKEQNNRKHEEGITAHQMVNNWLANDQNSFQSTQPKCNSFEQQTKFAWLDRKEGEPLTDQTKQELDRIRLQ